MSINGNPNTVAAEGSDIGRSTRITIARDIRFSLASDRTRRWILADGTIYNPDIVCEDARASAVIDEQTVQADAALVVKG